MFESVAPAILGSPIYRVRGAHWRFFAVAVHSQVAASDSSLKPSRLTNPNAYSWLLLVQVCGDLVQLVRIPVTQEVADSSPVARAI